MSSILGAAIGGGLLVAGFVMKSNAKSDVQIFENAKAQHKALGIAPPKWEDNKSMYESMSKGAHFNANVVLAVGVLVMVSVVFF